LHVWSRFLAKYGGFYGTMEPFGSTWEIHMREAEKVVVGLTGMKGVDLLLFRSGGWLCLISVLGVPFAMAEMYNMAIWMLIVFLLGWTLCAYASRKT
jgi:hypothetical protein